MEQTDKIPVLNVENVTELLKPSYELIDVSFEEDLDSHHDRIFRCIQERSKQTLVLEVDELYSDARVDGMHSIMDALQEQTVQAGYDKQQVEALFNSHAEQIQNAIFDRDKSDVLRQLLENTLPIPVRIQLRSNYDCLNSHQYESQDGYSYFESYFGDMVDALNLSPSRVKWRLDQFGIRTCGSFPRYKERNGKELVSYDDFCRELQTSHCPANQFTVLATLDPRELYRQDFDLDCGQLLRPVQLMERRWQPDAYAFATAADHTSLPRECPFPSLTRHGLRCAPLNTARLRLTDRTLRR